MAFWTSMDAIQLIVLIRNRPRTIHVAKPSINYQTGAKTLTPNFGMKVHPLMHSGLFACQISYQRMLRLSWHDAGQDSTILAYMHAPCLTTKFIGSWAYAHKYILIRAACTIVYIYLYQYGHPMIMVKARWKHIINVPTGLVSYMICLSTRCLCV